MENEMILEDLLPHAEASPDKNDLVSKRPYVKLPDYRTIEILEEREKNRKELARNFGKDRCSLIIFLNDEDQDIIETHKKQILLFPEDMKLKDVLASVTVCDPLNYVFYHIFRRVTCFELDATIGLLYRSNFFITPIGYLCGVRYKKQQPQHYCPISWTKIPPHLLTDNFQKFYNEYTQKLKQECNNDI